MSKYQILLFYKYINIDNPEQFLKEHQELCQSLNLTGRIIIAKEGINSTVEGLTKDTEKYIQFLTKDKRFKDIDFKKSVGTGDAFPKLSIKLRSEIVSSDRFELNPQKVTGKYITAEELHDWINSEKRFYMVDMRNDYEQAVGYFQNSILAPFENFRDLPKVLPILKDLQDEPIVTYCTGGIRCEKASGFLVKNGFKKVYQLFGGIVTYMEKYPNEDFLGKLYVFDGRVTMGFNLEDPKHKIVGQCKFCSGPAENYFDCKYLHCQNKRHYISCDTCQEKNKGFCSKECLKVTKNPDIFNVPLFSN